MTLNKVIINVYFNLENLYKDDFIKDQKQTLYRI